MHRESGYYRSAGLLSGLIGPIDELPGDVEPDDVDEGFFESAERDSFVERAKANLRTLFANEPETVFYQRQLQVMFEDQYFHWVTVRALEELVSTRTVLAERLPLKIAGWQNSFVRIYRAKTYRYWKRDADEVIRLVGEFSTPQFAQALGMHGEAMFDAAMPTVGFMPKQWKVRSHLGVEWDETGHDLDRIFERDGISYGVEIKNALSYIERTELDTKIKMCKRFGLRPLFIVRMAPKSYVNLVREAGGFTLIFKYQLYPFGQKSFAEIVKHRLRLPVDSPNRIAQGTMQRLLKWHLKQIVRSEV